MEQEPEHWTGERRAGAYGFSRLEIAALAAIVILAGAAGVYDTCRRRSAAAESTWVIEDVYLDTAAATARAGQDTLSPGNDPAPADEYPATVRVDVNTADASELIRLPGIGPELARRIIRERESGGRFTDLIDFQRVKGIGPKKASALSGWIRFTSPPDSIGSE